MSYCSISDVQERFTNEELVQLTNDYGSDTVDSDKITESIIYAENVINGYLRGRYSLPLNQVPDVLKCLAVDFVIYLIYRRRMRTDIPDSINLKYQDVINKLKDIQNGIFNIGAESSAFNNPTIKTNKTSTSSAINKYYDSKKWDGYDIWL